MSSMPRLKNSDSDAPDMEPESVADVAHEPPAMLGPGVWAPEVRQGRCASEPPEEEVRLLDATGLRPEIVRVAEKAAQRAFDAPDGPPKS